MRLGTYKRQVKPSRFKASSAHQQHLQVFKTPLSLQKIYNYYPIIDLSLSLLFLQKAEPCKQHPKTTKMKFNLATILAATLTATVAAAPTNEGMEIIARGKCSSTSLYRAVLTILHLANHDAVEGSHANFLKLWKEDGMNRWRWAFAGASCDEFKNSIKKRSGSINNFQCYEKDGKRVFDTNMGVGSVGDGAIITGVKAITRQPCCDLGLPDWGMDRCLADFVDDDAENNC